MGSGDRGMWVGREGEADMNQVGLLEGAAREGGREDPQIAAGAHPRSPISMMRSVMASCTEPPYTPE